MASGDRFKCNSCKYRWKTKKDYGEPPKCPNCRDKDIVNLTAPIRRERLKRERIRAKKRKAIREELIKKGKLVKYEGQWVKKKDLDEAKRWPVWNNQWIQISALSLLASFLDRRFLLLFIITFIIGIITVNRNRNEKWRELCFK